MNSPLLLLATLALCIGLLKAISVPVSYEDTTCRGPQPAKTLLCYYEGSISLERVDSCLCTHVVFSGNITTVRSDNFTVSLTTDVGDSVRTLRRRNPELVTVLRVTIPGETPLIKAERRSTFVSSLGRIVRNADLNGIEIMLEAPQQISNSAQAREGLSKLLKLLRKELGVQKTHRSRRDYSVFETIEDDVSTEAYSAFRKSSTRGTRTTAEATVTSPRHKTILRSARTDDDGKAREALRETLLELEKLTPKERVILLNLPAQPELLVKRYDLKVLGKYADLFVLPTHNLTDITENGLTYHPSRLMGLSDLLNTDSLVDLVSGLGAPRDKLIVSIPSQAIQFTLKNVTRNTPRSPVASGPKYLTQSQLCGLMEEGGWTIERDEDLTAPYAFRNKTWLAFDDSISVGIKSKYVLLRDLAGAAVFPLDAIDWQGSCHQEDNKTSSARLLKELHSAFTTLARKSRGAVLQTLQEDIHTSSLLSFSGEVHLSPYRIVRVIDNQGAVHVVRKDAKTEFECSRQGYFRHPLSCNRFYRCVKFNQYSSDFTVFEYDCPAGLAFDERWEVCVWPGSLPEGACHGSSEIAPVPRARYACPAIEGYYADPENCRWFFACLDHSRDGASPLTAYEFRCPFGLVFDQRNLVCQWPWLVEGCGNAGAYLGFYSGSIALGSSAGRGFAATAGNHGAGQAGKSTIVYETGPVAVQDIFGSSGIVGQVAASYISGGSASGGEGRHIDSYASFPDYLVSGGRIDKSGGVVLEGNLALSGVDRGQLRYSAGRGSYQEGGAAYQAGSIGSGGYVAASGAGGSASGVRGSSDGFAGAYGSRGGISAALGGQRGAAGSLAAGGVAYEVHGVEAGGALGTGSGAYLATGTGNAGNGAQSSSFRVDGTSGIYGTRADAGSRGGSAGTLAGGGATYEAHGIRAGAALNAGSGAYVVTGAGGEGAGGHSNTFRVDGSAGVYGTRAGARNRGGAAGTVATGGVAYGTQGSGATLIAGEALGRGVAYGVHGTGSGTVLTGGEAHGSRGEAGLVYGSHVETFGAQGGSTVVGGEALGGRTGAGVAYGTRVDAFGTNGNAALTAGLGDRSRVTGALGSGVVYGGGGATLLSGELLGTRSGATGALRSGVSYGTGVQSTEIHGNHGAAAVDLGAGLAYGTRIDTSAGGVLRSGSGVTLGQGGAVTYGAHAVGVQDGAYNVAGGSIVTPIAGGVTFGTRVGTSGGQVTSQAFGGKAGTYQPQGEVYQSAVYETNKITSGVPVVAVQDTVGTYQQRVVPKVEVAAVQPVVPVATVEKNVLPRVRLQPAVATVQPAIPITTYQQNVVSNVEAQPVVTTYQQTAIPKVQVQPAVVAFQETTAPKVSSVQPVVTYQQTLVPKVQVQPAVATYQQTIVPRGRARPTVATYQQNIAASVPIQPAVTTYQGALFPKVDSATIRPVPIASYQEVVQPNVQVTSVNTAIPVATYQETLTPKVSVSSAPNAIPVVTYQQTAAPRLRVRPTQPTIAVSTYQQAQQPEIQVSAVHPTVSTVLQTARPRVSFARVQPTTPAITYQQALIPQVSVSTSAPIVNVEQNVQPGVSFQTTYTGNRGYSRARPSVSVQTSGPTGYVSPVSTVFTTPAPAVTLPSASYSYSSTPAPALVGVSVEQNAQPVVSFQTTYTGSRGNSRTRPSISVETSGSAGYVSPGSAVFTTSAPGANLPSASYSYSSTPAPAPVAVSVEQNVQPGVSFQTTYTGSRGYFRARPSVSVQTSRPTGYVSPAVSLPSASYSYSSTPAPAPVAVSVEQNVQPGVSFPTTYTGSRGYSRARPSVSVQTSGPTGYVSPGSAVFTTSAPAISLPSASYSYSSTPAPATVGFSHATPAVQFLTGVVSSTPAPVQGYSRTSSKTYFPTSPVAQVRYQKTPVVVSTTAAPIVQDYSAGYSVSSGDSASTFISGIPSSTPSPIATGYSYRRPSVPAVPVVAPVAVSTPRPATGYVYSNPSVAVTSEDVSSSRFRTPISTPSVAVDYSYSKPIAPGGLRASGRGRIYSTTTASVPTFVESSTPAAVAVDYSVPFVSDTLTNSRPALVSNEYSYQKSSISAGRGRQPRPTESPDDVAARLGIGLEPASPSPALFNLPTFDNVEVANYGVKFQPTIKYSTPAPTFVSVTPTVLSVPNCTAASPNLRVSNIGYRGQYDFGSRSTGYVSTTTTPTVTYSTTMAPSTTARVPLPANTQSYRGNNAGARRGGVKTKISYDDGNVEALLDKYSGNFGGLFNSGKQEFIDEIVSTGGRGRQYPSTTAGYRTTTSAPYSTSTATPYRTSTATPYSTSTATPYSTSTSAPRGRARFGSTEGDQRVVVVTRLSDINPLLVAKLGAQCTCRPESPVLRLKPDDSEATPYAADLTSPRGYPSSIPEHIPSAPLPGSGLVTGSELSPDDNLGVRISSSAASTTPQTVLITTSRPRARSRNQYSTSSAPLFVSTTTSPSFAFTDEYSGTRSRTRPVTSTYAPAQASASQSRGRPLDIISSSAAPIFSDNSEEVEINGAGQSEAGVGGGRAFDRYGPGGWRGVDETLQGSVDCQRPGLFRHPKYCNKFYACHWDQWKGRYTLHVFNCPVHLAYDNSLGACNWPSKGPACTDDNLLV